MKALVFAPHPDDDLIGCGGSIAKLIKTGHQVTTVYMTSGDAGSLAYSKEELGQIREDEARQGARLLGVENLIFLRIPDGYVEYDRNNIINVINLIREERPNLVYLPHSNDKFMDHCNTFKIVNEAIKRAAGPVFQECQGTPWPVRKILAYEVWSPLQEVSYIEDITDFMELKITALRRHKSQLAAFAYDEAVQGLNRYRAAMTGRFKYCECFQVIKIDSVF